MMMFKQKFSPSGASKAFRAKLNSRRMCGSLRGLAGSLRSERGESIMEVIVSILIFSILMTTALAIVRTSLVITGGRIAATTELQEDVFNPLFLGVLPPYPDTVPGVITFSYDGFIIDPDPSHAVALHEKNGRLVFRPVP